MKGKRIFLMLLMAVLIVFVPVKTAKAEDSFSFVYEFELTYDDKSCTIQGDLGIPEGKSYSIAWIRVGLGAWVYSCI